MRAPHIADVRPPRHRLSLVLCMCVSPDHRSTRASVQQREEKQAKSGRNFASEPSTETSSALFSSPPGNLITSPYFKVQTHRTAAFLAPNEKTHIPLVHIVCLRVCVSRDRRRNVKEDVRTAVAVINVAVSGGGGVSCTHFPS